MQNILQMIEIQEHPALVQRIGDHEQVGHSHVDYMS